MVNSTLIPIDIFSFSRKFLVLKDWAVFLSILSIGIHVQGKNVFILLANCIQSTDPCQSKAVVLILGQSDCCDNRFIGLMF